MTLAEDFFDLFAGLDRAHGVTVLTKQKSAKGKSKGKSWLEWKPLTADLWEKHLDGTLGLGVVPIRDDGTVRWGAIDIDAYDLDHLELNKRINDLRLPLVLARSKSGGGHAFLFAAEDIDAQLVRDKLSEWAVVLGHPGVEIFPKQSKLASKQDVGNWLNMPYHDGSQSLRYALSKHSKALSPKTFIEYAHSMAVTTEQLTKIKPLLKGSKFWEGAPPCLQALSQAGFEPGTRNKVMFNIGVYLRKRYEQDWPDHLKQYNSTFFIPALEDKEVTTINRSLLKKTYSYTCRDDPLQGACNRRLCIQRKFGIGRAPDDLGVELGPMTILKLDPPIYIWAVDDQNVEFTFAQLQEQKLFQRQVADTIFKYAKTVRGETWHDLIADAMAAAEKLDVPEESTPAGQTWEALDDFCTGRAPARHRDEILNGKPWTEDGTTYFRIKDFIHYLKVQDVKGNTQQIYRWLRERGCTNGGWMIKGKSIRWWAVPEFDKQTEESEIPRIPQEAEF